MSDGQSMLKTSMLDLLHALSDDNIPLILGGGYRLYLKQVHLQDMGISARRPRLLKQGRQRAVSHLGSINRPSNSPNVSPVAATVRHFGPLPQMQATALAAFA